MIVRVKTPDGDGLLVGFAVETGSEEFMTVFHVLVARIGRPLEIHDPKEVKVLGVESEGPDG